MTVRLVCGFRKIWLTKTREGHSEGVDSPGWNNGEGPPSRRARPADWGRKAELPRGYAS
jgi:hypothetical protein